MLQDMPYLSDSMLQAITMEVCVYPCVLIYVLMTCSGSKEGVSLPEVTVNVSGKVLDSPEMDEWDDKQVCLCVVCVCV